MKKIYILLIINILSQCVFAQMPTDAIYMPKKSICAAAIYSNATWSKYWEGELKRDNPNIGKNITQSYSIMAAYGITDKLNAIVNLPYITTHNSAGNLLGQKGIQDFSAFLKYKVLNYKGLSLNTIIGGSVPMGNYVPGFLPMSIGLQSKVATGRLIAAYNHKSGMYLSASAAYHLRSNIKLDQDSYQAYGKVFYTNEVQMPNATDAAVRLGFLNEKLQLEGFLTQFACTSGDNIRRNDMPFPTNNMRAKAIGFYGKFQPKKLGFNASISKVLTGLNVGESLNYSVGILYQINFGKKIN